MSNGIHNANEVFISFASKDSELAHQLNEMLNAKNIKGYLFDSDHQYDSTLHAKITKAINDSQALIAIVTKESNSASVHEEIGYAFAKKKSVIIMLETDALDGVLSHERDQECFTKESFGDACSNVIQYVQRNIVPKVTTSVESTEFLQRRNMLDGAASNFCVNPNSAKIKNSIMNPKITAHPVVMFSSCPKKLLDDIPITSQQYSQWSKAFSNIPVSRIQVGFLQGEPKIELGKITYYYYYNSHDSFTRYVEIHSNGFVEQGYTHPLIKTPEHDSLDAKARLHSCWTAGTFWAFLVFCNKHYLRHNYVDEIDIFLSIRDAQALTLGGFGSTRTQSQRGYDRTPHIAQQHLQIKKEIKAEELSENRIEEIIREFTDKIANAYGLESALYDNQDGAIDRDLLTWFR